MPVLLAIWGKFMSGSDYDVVVERVLIGLHEFYRCLEFDGPDGGHPFHLPDQVVKDLQGHIETFLLYYSLLTSSVKGSQMMWNLVPKFHYFYHVGEGG